MKRLQSDRAAAHRPLKRRHYDASFKRHLVQLSLVPGASVAQIALDHRLNANLLFKWRRAQLCGPTQAATEPAAGLLPVTVAGTPGAGLDAPAQVKASTARKPRTGSAAGVIEIDLPLGRVRLSGAVDLAAVRVVIEALSLR